VTIKAPYIYNETVLHASTLSLHFRNCKRRTHNH